jgi:O-antigen/teichoic acid export membrane protein
MFLFNNKFVGNKKRVITNVLWSILGKIVNMLGALFVGILVARYLGPAQYGLMNYVISYVALFTVIATFGMSNIEVRELSNAPDEKDKILGTCFCIRLFFSTVAYIILMLSLLIYKTDKFTTIMILLYGVTLYTTCCFELVRNYFTSIIKNEYVVKSEIARTLVGACVKIILLYFHAPLWTFIAAVVFDSILVASGYIVSYHKEAGVIRNWKYDKTVVQYFLKQSFPLLLSGAAIIVYQRIDQVMIGNMINSESVGYFATASKFLDVVLYIPTILVQTITPLLVQWKSEDEVKYNMMSQRFINIVVWISILLALIVSLISYWLIRYTYGMMYLAAVPILQIMAWKVVGMALSNSGGQLIIIEKKQKWAVIRNLFGCLVCIILNLLFIPRYGAVGSAIVTICTVITSGYLANSIIPPYRKFFKMETVALFMGWKDLVYIKSFIKK